MLSNLSCFVSDRSSVMRKSNTLFNEGRENLFKENIPAFGVQGKSRSDKNLVTINKLVWRRVQRDIKETSQKNYKHMINYSLSCQPRVAQLVR